MIGENAKYYFYLLIMSPVVLLYKDNNGKKCVKFYKDSTMKIEDRYSFSSLGPDTVF